MSPPHALSTHPTLRPILAAGLILIGGACAMTPSSSERGQLAGHWSGAVAHEGDSLAIALAFATNGDSLQAAFSSADLMLLDQPLGPVVRDGAAVRIEARDQGEAVRIEATLAGDTLRGTMQISGEGEATPPMPFALARATAPARPYRSEEVTFANGQVTLSGTVFTPAAGRPRGAVVFVHGSSLNLRDGYRFHADHFARAGFVTLTYDKRGSGRSTGSYQAATLDDLVGDAIAAVQMLRSRPGVDSSRVGVWGLSQGGTLVPLVAQRAPVAFVIAVSGPGVSFGETAAWQDSVGLVRRGFAVADAAAAASIHRRLTEWMRTGEGDAEITALLARTAELPWRRHTGIPRQPPTAAERHGWYWATRPLDPVEWWRAVRVPTLVLFGEADPLLPARRSADLITAALRAAGNDDARVVVFPGADHMLRTSARAAGGGWAWPRAAPGYQDTVTAWLARMAR